MNVHEAAGVIAFLGSSWPHWKLSDDTADVWASELAPLNVEQAREAAKNLLRTSEHAPTVAAFLEQYRQIAYHQRIAQPVPAIEQGDDTEPAVPPPTELIAGLRELLAQQKVPNRATPATPEREPVVLPKSRCPRCGQDTIPYVWTLEPKQVERPVGFDEAYSGETQ